MYSREFRLLISMGKMLLAQGHNARCSYDGRNLRTCNCGWAELSVALDDLTNPSRAGSDDENVRPDPTRASTS